jgi:hypothetical protein
MWEEEVATYLAEFPELRRLELQHGNSGFMNQSRRRVPWLDLLPEQDLDFWRVFLADQRKDWGVDFFEHFCWVRADVVEIELQGVEGWSTGCGELLSCKFGCKGHFDGISFEDGGNRESFGCGRYWLTKLTVVL